MSLPKELAENTVARIRDRFGLQELEGPEGGPFQTLKSAMSPAPAGEVRVFTGKPLQKLVTVSLVVPQIGLDSHMLFAFTPEGSAIPHFTVDSVSTGQFYAFHLDLIPRADLGAHLAYMNATHHPLTATFEAMSKLEGLSPAKLSPRQIALMSPWMLASRATEEAFAQIPSAVNAYLDHWFTLMERGISPEALPASVTPAALAERDLANRAALFSAEIDPVWNQVDRLLGEGPSARLRDMLKSQKVK